MHQHAQRLASEGLLASAIDRVEKHLGPCIEPHLQAQIPLFSKKKKKFSFLLDPDHQVTLIVFLVRGLNQINALFIPEGLGTPANEVPLPFQRALQNNGKGRF